jgi:hypothetical protein
MAVERIGMRGLKRKMSVIDEEEKPFRMGERIDIDDELDRLMMVEGEEMGEMGQLVVDPELRGGIDLELVGNKLSKRTSWRKSLREWWRKV